jgi:eukaryotic-like serine/threonine-protein kinase
VAEFTRSQSVPLERPPSRAVRWSLVIVAMAYAGYLGLLITSDLLRVVPLGFVPEFGSGGVTVASVQPATVAAREGLRPGDRLVRANGQTLRDPLDWQRVRVSLDAATPLELEGERGGQPLLVRLPLSAGLTEWQTSPSRPGLLAFRLAQVITLGLAMVVGLRRASQPAAVLGALLLASFATVSLVLPIRMLVFWRALPQPLEALLWLPYTTSGTLGPLLFAFFAVFPKRRWSWPKLAAALVPGVLTAAWVLYEGYHLTRALGPPSGLPDRRTWTFAISVLYAMAAVALLIAHQRSAESLTDRRRIRVLLGGMATGVTAGVALLFVYQLEPGADIFGNPILSGLALMFLAVPASFAYAILRHRLFDLRLIVRQGVRYALARRLLDALIPIVAGMLLVQVVVHRDEPLVQMLQSRWWWYSIGIGALLLIRHRRESWLNALDRRFFRERYDAERLLKNIVSQISRAASVEAIVPSMVQQIDEALHPEFVEVLRHATGDPWFTPVTPSSRAHATLPASLATIGVLSALRKPLALSLGDTAWVRHQLPAAERALLLGRDIELMVPVFNDADDASPAALLVLGPRRSEEPYNDDDLDLLATIAQGLGLLIGRSWTDAHGLAECGACGRCFDGGTPVCAADGHALTSVPGSRVLNGRYRLERRLGRGGMGTVYEALDDVLERKVAVKVIREDLVGPLFGGRRWADLDTRFRQEARAGAGFAHPHVVRVYDFGVDRDRRAFLVMELLQGETLRQRLVAGPPLAPREVLQLLRGVCEALTAAHGHALIHRDLKPENIFLQRLEGGVTAKVLDFGLAKALAAEWPEDQPEETHGTSAGLLIGTLDYMAPEQVAGDAARPEWDVWALTVIAYEMLTGRHPFRRTVTFAASEEGGCVGAGRVTEDGASLSAAAAAFFDQALSADRARRPTSVAELLARCEQVMA